MPKFHDITGQRFGRLVAVRFSHMNRQAYWACRCDCGNEKVIKGGALTSGAIKSCGCSRRMPITAEGRPCSRCKRVRPLSEFGSVRSRKYGVHPHCRECRNASQRAWAKENRSKIRDISRKVAYGITPSEYNALFEQQGRVCAICKTTNPKHKYGWSVDHCHNTNEVRGILCQRCNTALGQLERYMLPHLPQVAIYLKRDLF